MMVEPDVPNICSLQTPLPRPSPPARRPDSSTELGAHPPPTCSAQQLLASFCSFAKNSQLRVSCQGGGGGGRQKLIRDVLSRYN